MSTAMEQLSTGTRVNSAKDDAAGLAIVSNMTSKIQGLDMSVRNANDAISMIQTADGALDGMVNMVQRMRELAVQSSNSTLTAEQRGFLNLEFQELKNEIDRSAKNTDWNGKKILNQEQGSNGQYTFQVGTQAGQIIDIDIPNFAVDGSSTRIPLPISTGNIDLSEKYSNIRANKGPGIYQLSDSWMGSSLLVKYNQIDYKITLPTDSNGQVNIAQLNNGTWQTIGTDVYRSDQIYMVIDGLKKIPTVNNNFNIVIRSGDSFRLTNSNSNSLGENISFQVSRGTGTQSELIQLYSFATPLDQNKSSGEYTTSGDWLGSSLLVNYNQKDYKVTLPLTSAGLVSIQKLTNGIWTQVSTTPYEASYQATLGYQTMLVEGLKKINKDLSPELSTRLKHLILSVGGNYEQKDVREFVDNYLLAKDSRALRDYIKSFQPDVNMTINHVDADGFEEEVTIPVTLNFFWPES
jgi:flagellin-like hook-associated protein FlgL